MARKPLFIIKLKRVEVKKFGVSVMQRQTASE
jgi:hypothetical protein